MNLVDGEYCTNVDQRCLRWLDEDTREEVLWLIGGDEADVDALLDAIEEDDHEDHDHPN